VITTDPIGDWMWEVPLEGGGVRALRAAETAVAVWNVLASHELAVPAGKVDVSVRPTSNMMDFRINVSGLALERDPLAEGTSLSHVMKQADELEGDFLVTVRIDCPGLWEESGGRYRAEKLFNINVDMWGDSLLAVTLETYSDAWLTVDTRDRDQPDVHAANAPRLAAALQEISALLGTPLVPGDANRFATPTETGFEDPRIDGPAYDDSWGTFEPPARAARLRAMLPDSEDEYEVITDCPVRYFTIRRDEQTLGYLWASTGDEAAGYAPRTAAGDAAFEAGVEWLLRLRDAHSRGLSALAALTWVTHSAPRPEIGLPVGDAPEEAPSLDALEELSGRY
jgi:hypothetical protein